MSEKEKQAEPLTLFGHPIKDWVVLFTLMASFWGGLYTIGGSPNQTRDAIRVQADSLSEGLSELKSIIRINTTVTQQNTIRINDLEVQNDQLIDSLSALRKTTVDGLKNLDGYFRGRLDQIK